MSINIIEAQKGDLDKLSEASARAYHDDPLFAWMYPGLGTRKNLKYLFKMGLVHAHRHGMVHAPDNLKGLAAWVPYEKSFMSTWELVTSGMISFLLHRGKSMKNITAYEDFIEERHKHHVDFPHWYLQNLAVSPEHQGKGIGSALLERGLAIIDGEGLPAYLETQNEKNIKMYEGFGFTLLEGKKVPGTDIDLYFMFREKKGKA